MALIPLIDCYELLDLDPKTIRSSLKRAGIATTPHPTDTRIKCLTTEQIEMLATRHARVLRPSRAEQATSPAQAPALPSGSSSAAGQAVDPLASAPLQDDPLSQRVSTLEGRVAQLSDQLAQLALHLLQQRDHTLERRLSTLEMALQEGLARPVSFPSLKSPEGAGEKEKPLDTAMPARPPNPAEVRARSRMPPLIEYSPQGMYVIVSSQEGELDVKPDEEAWFEWLASITSFRFVGQAGRFSACRDSDHGQHTRCWIAHRSVQGRRYKQSLGLTDRLTIACLEQMAARLEAAITTA